MRKAKIYPFTAFVLVVALLSQVSGPTLAAAQPGEVGLAAEDHNCRFWGIISTDVPAAVIQDHLVNLPSSIEALSPSNPDGWSVGYYPDGNSVPTVNRGFPAAHSDPNFDAAVDEAALATPRIAVSHIRNTSSGITPASGDPHPFERVKDGRHWLMGHNGTIDKDVLLDLIRADYFAANPPLYGSNQSEWIDSDLYQIFVLQTLEDFNFQVKPALGYVIQRLRDEIGTGTSPSTEQLNFFLTDGTTLWAYHEGLSTHTLYYLYDATGTPYSAVASQYPSASQGSWVEIPIGDLITMQQDSPPVVEDIEDYFGNGLLVDNYFDDSADSVALRANSAGQDWYESRELEANLLTLDETTVGGNGSKKAAFEASATGNAYVSQEFGTPQAGVFAVQWDIYVDEILDIGDPDRAGWMLIGDNTDPTRTGPNSDDSERFVYMSFFRDGGGTTGTADLVARDRDDGWTAFTTVASGLNLGQWYTIRVVCDIPGGAYDVYVDGVLQDTVLSRHEKTSVTHISFAQWDDGAGAFYIDNVYRVADGTGHTLTMAVDPAGGGTTDPSIGAHTYPEDTTVNITAYANAGYEFDYWTGDVANPNSASTTVLMDGDKTVTAHFSSVPVVFLADNDFNASVDSADLRANSPGQDWYESREQDPNLLTLDETMVGGNGSKKAAFASSASTNAYVSQEFGTPQTGVFAVQWDIYVDTILDISDPDPDRAGWMLIGDDTDPDRPGPNSNPSERFVQMAFYRDGGGSSGTMDLVARERGADFTAFTTVASGLNMDQWYTIRVDCDIPGGTYDIYVDGAYQATVTSYNEKTSVTHISFGQWHDGAGAFYVDNVYEVTETTYILTMAVNPTGGGTTTPSVGAHAYAEDEVVTISASANAGYEFDHWSGDVANPNAATTTVVMDENQTVTAHFAPTGAPTCVTIQRSTLGDVADGYIWEARPTGGNFTSSDFRSGLSGSGETRALIRFGLDFLPEDAVVQSAVLGLDQRSPASGETVYIYPINQAWSEGEPTWNSHASSYDASTSASFASTGGTIAADVTNLVSAWVDGSRSNYGMMLINSPALALDLYISSEYSGVARRPWLEVCYVEAVNYVLTMAADPTAGGTTDPTVGAHAYPEDEIVTITAYPSAGYEFDHWSGDVANPNAASTTVTMDGDKTVTAHFSLLPTTYELTMAVDPTAGGTTDPAVGVHTYPEDEVVAVTAYAGAGYEFDHWSGDVADPNAASTTVTMDGDKTVTAHFSLLPITYELTMAVDPTAGGTTDPSVGAHTYPEDEIVALTAYAGAGYEFDHWSGDVADPNSASTTVTMDGDKTVTAHFTLLPTTYELTMAVDPTEGGTTDPAVGVHAYPEDEVVDITAIPNAGYQFDNWTGDVADPNSASTTVTMDGDKTVTAHFSLLIAPLLVDTDFEASVDSADLRADDPDQDWYESRADVPELLTLDTGTVGGNSSNKAKLDSYGVSDNAYLTQDFNEAQSGVFVVSMDVYVDQIEDSGSYDRTGHIYIGYEDAGGTNGPNSTSNERFVFMAFYDSTPGTSGDDIVLKARTSSAQAYGTTSQWTDVATGLSYDTWHTIKIQCDVAGGTYDVYVDDLLVGDDISCYAGYASSSVTHISFVADDTGRGTFYVDDVHGFNDLTMVGPVPAAGGITDPVAAVYTYPENMDVPITAAPYAGYQFDYWTGGVTAPGSASTTVPMDADRTVVAHFSLLPPVFLADNNFDASMDTADLRANGLGQDWYESRGEDPTLLTLNTGDIDGNSTNKAGFAASLLGNAYVSQEFGTPQGGIFSVRWDICVDNILDDAARDRAGLMLIGDDNDGTNGPNSTGGDRFVYMGFYCEDGCETGTMSLIANEPGDSYDDSATWRTVATGLALDQWHTIQVVCDLGTDTYNVYVNDTLVDSGVEAQTAKGTLTHISFAQWNDGAGAFYVDNVQQSTILVDHIVVAPASVTLGPDVEQQFTATGYYDDGDLNPIVGLGFSWAVVAGGGTIDQDGLFTAGTTGTYTNTVEATAEGIHGYASVTVEQGEAVEIQVLPEEATITAGETLEYSSRAKDDSTPPNIWDATAETVFSINDDALGSWGGADLNWYTSEVAGHWTVAGVYTGVYSEVLTATASLTVVHASAVSLEIAPADETVTAGGSVTYEATAEDAYGNTWPATGETVFSIVEGGAGGSWADNVYTSEVAGDWTVRGEYEGVPDTANLSVNAPPVAEDDEATTDEDTPVDINVLGNDSDADGSLDPTTVVIVTGPTDGSFSVDPVSGEVTYTPYADYYGSDTFTYTVEDDDGATSNEATVTVTVDPVNDAPVANDDAMSTPEDTAVIIDVLANDPDVDDAVLTISDYDTTSTEGGTVTCTGVCTYTPPGDFSGTDTFTYTVSDGDLTDIATVTITVGVTNDPPVAVNDAYGVSEGNTLSVAAAAGVLYNDSDADADSLTASLVSGPSHGTLTLDTDGSFTYVHDGSETTSDSFTYQANDGFADSNVATVAITVTPVNVAPVVSDIPGQTVAEGGTFVTISLDDYVSDVDNTDAEMTWTYSGDTDLTVTIVGRVATIGIPGGDWNGSETITFTATDPGGESDSDDATFTVTAAAPVAPEFLIYLPIISNNHVLSGSTSGW